MKIIVINVIAKLWVLIKCTMHTNQMMVFAPNFCTSVLWCVYVYLCVRCTYIVHLNQQLLFPLMDATQTSID